VTLIRPRVSPHVRERIFRTSLTIDCPRGQVFAFFADAQNLERITPPELRFRILTPLPIVMRQGARIDYALRLYGVPLRWDTLIKRWEPPDLFVDEQLSGPYDLWIHTHTFREVNGGTEIDDEIRYALPFPPVGEIAAPIVARRVARIFAYRTEAVRRLLTPAG
jgi:ligand-binding SRPBCC domain-containing protein